MGERILVEGRAGTGGRQATACREERGDLELLEIDDSERKNDKVKRDIIDAADLVILCLPDDAARDTVALAADGPARLLDASTAHRVNPDWVYGLPELCPTQRESIAGARLVSNPGCYPTGFLLATRPLVDEGLLKKDAPLTINALSGYSGGGRKMIERYEARAAEHPDNLWYHRPYALSLSHKHVPEMTFYAGLDKEPFFLPSVGHFAQGMLVNVPLFRDFLASGTTIEQITNTLKARYADEPCVEVHEPNSGSELEDGFLDPQANNGTNHVDIFVYGHEEQVLLVSRLDNLGKGASGAAVQNLNLMLGTEELHGLRA
ncbi:MAG: N-acetyl-gamma-glutamyl-phosphate reductase [Pseudomonadales bacterium]|nr:N-acetyl-gamma-glutamyl-phosphate reductase [Pseudomonadales bacterium]